MRKVVRIERGDPIGGEKGPKGGAGGGAGGGSVPLHRPTKEIIAPPKRSTPV